MCKKEKHLKVKKSILYIISKSFNTQKILCYFLYSFLLQEYFWNINRKIFQIHTFKNLNYEKTFVFAHKIGLKLDKNNKMVKSAFED